MSVWQFSPLIWHFSMPGWLISAPGSSPTYSVAWDCCLYHWDQSPTYPLASFTALVNSRPGSVVPHHPWLVWSLPLHIHIHACQWQANISIVGDCSDEEGDLLVFRAAVNHGTMEGVMWWYLGWGVTMDALEGEMCWYLWSGGDNAPMEMCQYSEWELNHGPFGTH
ncbi:hypothetical protein F5141DRAFT_1064470 [Pisolithus sp. B1]|nr:hypothetical protein F5141DRAFT_1064470 [Pisolithus sp. B1]